MSEQTVHLVNGIRIEDLNTTVEAIRQDPDLGKCQFHITNKWINGNHNHSSISSFYGAKQELSHTHRFELDCDEPPVLGGEDTAPNPVEHMLNALGGCMTTTLVAHAARRGIYIEEMHSEIQGNIDLSGYLGLSENVPKGFKDIRMRFKVKTDFKDLEALRRFAEYSPVYNTMKHGCKIDLLIESM